MTGAFEVLRHHLRYITQVLEVSKWVDNAIYADRGETMIASTDNKLRINVAEKWYANRKEALNQVSDYIHYPIVSEAPDLRLLSYRRKSLSRFLRSEIRPVHWTACRLG